MLAVREAVRRGILASMKSFEEFWPYYVKAHSNKWNRRLHFVGTTAALGLAVTGVVTGSPLLVLAAPAVGYGCAWFGHFVLEGNTPASFGHPLWSFKGDWVMWSKMLTGTMDEEVARVLAESEKPAQNGVERPAEPQAAPVN